MNSPKDQVVACDSAGNSAGGLKPGRRSYRVQVWVIIYLTHAQGGA
jgi:hypothetical protein